MIKMFKSPERVYALSMWVVSLVFASFLLGLGSKVIQDVPSATQDIDVSQFMPPQAQERLDNKERLLEQKNNALTAPLERAVQAAESASNDYAAAQSTHRNWLSTRRATSNNPQSLDGDKDLEERTRRLDTLAQAARDAQSQVERMQAQRIDIEQSIAANAAERSALIDNATPEYTRALEWKEMKIFGIRLLITLPLLGTAVWLVRTQRKSKHWPLARGFIIFAVITFFFELVPYLPSYGGYIRYLVGIGMCIFGGHYGISAMQRYLEKRKLEEQQNEHERRLSLDRDTALSKMESHLCPGCDRKIPTGLAGQDVNHCVHCGMTLFSRCPEASCSARNNAFYHFCPVCGTNKETPLLPLDKPLDVKDVTHITAL